MSAASPPYRFDPLTRRIMAAVVETMMPRWPDWTPPTRDGTDFRDQITAEIERMLDFTPRLVRFGIPLLLWTIQLAGPVLVAGLLPFTWLNHERRVRRLRRMGHSRFVLVRDIVGVFRIFVNMAAYAHPDVEAHLGVPRRAWRDGRALFRARLLAADSGRDRPAPPEALGSAGVCEPEAYLDPEAS